MKAFRILCCAVVLLVCLPLSARQLDVTITNSGDTKALELQGNTGTFEELISGSPSTVSIVLKGCMRAGTCDTLETNTRRFRDGMTRAGFEIKAGSHPIVPIMLYDEKLAHEMARRLLEAGIYVIGFSYPVVPKGQARIRVQLSAAHSDADIDRAIEAFAKVGRELGVVK